MDSVSNDSIGNFLVGLLLPYVQTNNFFYTVSEIPKEQEDVILDLLDELDLDEELNDIFPEFLAHIINPVHEGAMLEWSDPRHEMVAYLFANHMLEKGFDEVITETEVLLWSMYCLRKDPSIQ